MLAGPSLEFGEEATSEWLASYLSCLDQMDPDEEDGEAGEAFNASSASEGHKTWGVDVWLSTGKPASSIILLTSSRLAVISANQLMIGSELPGSQTLSMRYCSSEQLSVAPEAEIPNSRSCVG